MYSEEIRQPVTIELGLPIFVNVHNAQFQWRHFSTSAEASGFQDSGHRVSPNRSIRARYERYSALDFWDCLTSNSMVQVRERLVHEQ